MSAIFPMVVYGSDVSYFTGKLEMYLRLKGMDYTFEPMVSPRVWNRIRKETGVQQMPACTLADGRWVTDTTPLIAWLEAQQPAPPVIPADPLQRFFSLLMEDYADEWLWRPAMHYRWWYPEGRAALGWHLAAELMAEMPLPAPLKRAMIRRRQLGGFVTGDGVTKANCKQVEQAYHDNLAWLSAMLEERPYLLGNSPSLADVAFMGPMFRHFSQDPVPAEIMRTTAPRVWEWVARTWAAGPQGTRGDWVSGIPDDWGPLLRDIGATYLPYLCELAEAVRAGRQRADLTAGGVTYPGARISPYRVWCLARLREEFEALPEPAKEDARALLERHGCWEPLWRSDLPETDVNVGLDPPFRGNATMV